MQNMLAKQAAGEAAASLVEEGMVVGLGTGTTVGFLIKKLGQRCQKGLKICAACSSIMTERMAYDAKIPLATPDAVGPLDLYMDGADEIDRNKQMIKGGGGALFREKILARLCKEMIVIVDDSKVVDYLGRFLLPLEISPFAPMMTLEKLKELGIVPKIRMNGERRQTSDNGNFLVDCSLPYPIRDPQAWDAQIKDVPGVIETGFFLKEAGRVVVGFADGHIEIYYSFQGVPRA